MYIETDIPVIQDPLMPPEQPQPPKKLRTPRERRAAQLLLETHDLLSDPEHWIQGSMRDLRGGFCLLGGIEEKKKQGRYSAEVKQIAEHSLALAIDKRATNVNSQNRDTIVNFNDFEGRRHRAILMKLRQAANSLLGN